MPTDGVAFTIIMAHPEDERYYLTVRGGMNRYTQRELAAGNPVAWQAVLQFCDDAHTAARQLPIFSDEDPS